MFQCSVSKQLSFVMLIIVTVAMDPILLYNVKPLNKLLVESMKIQDL